MSKRSRKPCMKVMEAPWLSIFDDHMVSISSNDYSDSGALPSSSTSGSSDHPPNPKRQHRDWKSTDHQSFKEEWRKQFFVIPHPNTSGQCICLVCLTVFNQFKVYTIKRHFESKRKNLMSLEPDDAASKYETLLSAYNKEREALSRPVTIAFCFATSWHE